MVNMRPFTDFEQANIKFLVNHNVKFTQVEVTPTGLGKGILDSTAPMRAFFLENGIHNYEEQKQGPENKQLKKAVILTHHSQHITTASFYRPNTKKGDPRMWIYGLGSYTAGNDIHVLFWFDETLYSINITQTDIERSFNSDIITPMQDVIKSIIAVGNSISDELLGKFRSVSGQWFESEVLADTGIGRTIETFLGIKMNSGKTPDYKGIELKSHRDKRISKKNVLFTQAPDWDISALKSGRQIVDKYGYYTDNGLKTYQSTVRCFPPNRQSLFLNVNLEKNYLELLAEEPKKEDVAAWRLVELHKRLRVKHHETFWIEVENVLNEGKEFFRYKQIEHTKNPCEGQFDVLLEQNLITVDFMLCRPSGHGDNYSFKIKKQGMPLLFPESILYVI